MGKMQRNKGANAERELSKLLDEQLGTSSSRNLFQTQCGGHDLLGIPHIALEVKRQENLSIGSWWTQTVKQALIDKSIPVLAYRQSRQPWRFIVPLNLLLNLPVLNNLALEYTVTVELEAFCMIYREKIGK